MNLSLLALAALGLALGLGLGFLVRRSRRPLMLQFGRYARTREGDTERGEPELVHFHDYRYWLRLRPNPGVNLPLVGYWSRARGFHRRKARAEQGR